MEGPGPTANEHGRQFFVTRIPKVSSRPVAAIPDQLGTDGELRKVGGTRQTRQERSFLSHPVNASVRPSATFDTFISFPRFPYLALFVKHRAHSPGSPRRTRSWFTPAS